MRKSARHTFAGRTAAIAVAAAALSLFAAPSFGQTWTYDPDVGPGDQFPNSPGQPFETGAQVGANANRTIEDIGAPDNKVLQMDTDQGVLPNGTDGSIYFQITGPNTNWTVTDATGYSVATRFKLDSVTATQPGAFTFLAGNPTNFSVLRVYNPPPFPNSVRIAIQDSSGNGGQVIRDLPNPTEFHDYRMDVQNGVASVYFDDYPFPVLSKNLAAGGSHAIWFGDGTGPNDGKYQIDSVTSWQNGPVGTINAPNVRDTNHTLFLAHYDGNTGNGGLDADFAAGSATVVGNGALPSGPGKYGAAAVDVLLPDATPNTLSYSTAGNFNTNEGTIEMWLNATDWQDFAFQGILAIADPGNLGAGDIRIQKTSGNTLQATMSANSLGEAWNLTTGDLSTTFTDGQYHHVAWTWDFDANATALYVDGQVEADRFGGLMNNIPNSSLIDFNGTVHSTMEVGTLQGGSNPFKGLIDELRISSVDLYGGLPFTPEATAWDDPGLTLLLGDADNSGTVTADDLIAVQQNFGNIGPNGDGTDIGDANDDGTVTADDLISVQQNFGNTLGAAASAVPEPGTLCVAMIAAVGIFRRAGS